MRSFAPGTDAARARMRGKIAKLWVLLLRFDGCFSSLRGAQATKQSIPCLLRRYWIASLRSQ
jgi:hypothetical protein